MFISGALMATDWTPKAPRFTHMRTKTSLPLSARRGAARISAVWLIVAFVLLAVAVTYAFIAQDEAAVAKRELATANQERDAAVERESAAKVELSNRSEQIGFTTDAATIPSDVAAMKAGFEDLKSAFPDTEPAKTYQDLIPLVKSAYATQLQKVAQNATRIKELEGRVAAERQAKGVLESDKDEQIAALRSELTDLKDTSESEISRLTSASEDLRTEVNTYTEQVTALTDKTRDTERSLAESKKIAASVKRQATERIKMIAKRSEKADGEISGVSLKYGIGFINLTSSDRLSEGTTFRIVSGRPGADTSIAKGYCTVTNVGPELSEVTVFDMVDPLGQPIVPGDQIFNPLYEPKGERNAVLAGSIDGIYNRPELEILLGEIGITIQDELSNTTDFLITGGPMFVDEEGEPLESPLKVEQLPIYAEARDRGVLVVPMRDVTQYFRR